MIAAINKFLLKQGTTLRGEPLLRLVWSTDQTEIRLGTFNDFYGHIFVRTVREVRMVHKYPYLRDRWVLEMWIPPAALQGNPELVNSHEGSYEPIYVFEDAKGQYLEPNFRVVELIVGHLHKPRVAELTDAERLTQEIKEHESRIDTSGVQNALHLHEAIVNPSGDTKYGGK